MAAHLITADNRKYENIELKYDAFYQTVHFLKGKDSLEVNEAIKNFILVYKNADSISYYAFHFFPKVEKQAGAVFLELLAEGSKAALYKLNKKIVVDMSKALPGTATTEYFDLKTFYYFQDKQTNKLPLLKDDNSNLETLAKVKFADTGMNKLSINAKDESELITFLRYVNSVKN